MQISNKVKTIIIEILKNKANEKTKHIDGVLLFNDLFLEIIKNLEEKGEKIEVTCIENEKIYIFKGENHKNYLEIIAHTFEKLIDDNLLKISTDSLETPASISFVTESNVNIDNFMISKIKNKLNSHIYITPELVELFKWNPLKNVIVFIPFVTLVIILLGTFFKYIKNDLYFFLSLIIIVFIVAMFNKKLKAIFDVFKYPFLDMDPINSLFGFFAFIVSLISLVISLIGFKSNHFN